jgi:ribosomal protein S18 acetylase RimI-like enzyme
MWVAPEYRGDGVGMALVEQVRKWAYKRNIENLLLSVTTVNSAAMSLYKKIGFETIGQTELLRPGSTLESQIMEAKLNANDS